MTNQIYDEIKASELERAFHTRWQQLAPPGAPQPTCNYQFTEKRKFRIDWAWPPYKVGIELQGGTWSGGAHVRGAGYRRDCEKLNLAQGLGWTLFWVTAGMLEDNPQGIVRMVLGMLESRMIYTVTSGGGNEQRRR